MTLSAPLPQRQTGTGIALMLAAMALVPMIDVFAKQLAQQGLSALQIIFMRMAFGTILLLPAMIGARRLSRATLFGTGPVWQPLLMGFSSLCTGIFFFSALRWMSIADTLAISFVQPLFTILLSRFLLKERVSAARWIALVAGFAGTMLIIRPTSAAFEPASFLALASGASMSVYAIVVRAGAGRTPALVMTFQTHAIAALLGLPLMIWVWQMPSGEQWLTGVMLALIGLVGQYLIVRAYDYCEASLLAPLSYTEIVTSTLASWWFFRQLPDAQTYIGVAILIACAILVTRRH
ncbi:MAG: DMT family transporter [Paracoccaceae bacterium]